MRKFNTRGLCNPKKHYMVDISETVEKIKAMVDEGDYFCMKRPHQYGKTTTLAALCESMKYDYVVWKLDFQEIGHSSFLDEGEFCRSLSEFVLRTAEESDVEIPVSSAKGFRELAEKNPVNGRMYELFAIFSDWCKNSSKSVVLIIDEIDSATNHQVFWDFLARLRALYLQREEELKVYTFLSVILAGVTDVQSVREKMWSDSDHKRIIPWNISARFDIDMSLSEIGIKDMLDEYKADYHTGMNTAAMAFLLWKYTSGYPYLVSRLCQLMDEAFHSKSSVTMAWSNQGLDEAINIILADEYDPFFKIAMEEIKSLPQIKIQLYDYFMKGNVISWIPDDEEQKILSMHGFIVNKNHTMKIANNLIEMRLYQCFFGKKE